MINFHHTSYGQHLVGRQRPYGPALSTRAVTFFQLKRVDSYRIARSK